MTLTEDDDPAQVISTLHVGVVGDGGEWGRRLREFMLSDKVAAVYRHHGLASVR